MNRTTFAIGILSLTATVMATALLVAPAPTTAAPAGVVARERDFSMITANLSTGGDGLYILDHRRGVLAVFTFDNNSRTLRLRAAAPMARAFPGGGAGR
ncbi:MAG: hypothetical protein ACK4PI_07970 [Tepidisphaerales bacterium]